jgi:large subunit ribosomal protein L1
MGWMSISKKSRKGWTDVDVVITMPSIMPKVGALGKILGPRGLMPNPKTGTVTMEVGKAVTEAKAGKIDFKVDKFGIYMLLLVKSLLTKPNSWRMRKNCFKLSSN